MTQDQPHDRYFLRTERVRRIVEENHLYLRQVAAELGIDPCHWSKVLNRRLPASRELRRRMKESPLFADEPEATLWQLVSQEDAPPRQKEPTPRERAEPAYRRPRFRLPFPEKRFLMSRAAAVFAANRAGLNLAELGEQLGIAEAYWFQICAGRIPVGRRRRLAIQQHPAFTGIPHDQLWVVAVIPFDPAAIQPIPPEVSP
jgi:transcriptional regulator with XRE-family HTH domain